MNVQYPLRYGLRKILGVLLAILKSHCIQKEVGESCMETASLVWDERQKFKSFLHFGPFCSLARVDDAK